MKKNTLTSLLIEHNLMIITIVSLISICVYSFLTNSKSDLLISHRKALLNANQGLADADSGVGGSYKPDVMDAPVTFFTYTIQEGESIYSIARKYSIDDVSLVNINEIKFASHVNAGKDILIPNQDGIMVNVKTDKDIDTYANQYNLDKEEIARVNSNDIRSIVKNGKVFLPGVKFDSVTRQMMLGEYFIRPAYGRITSYFGYRRDPWTGRRSFHQGLDIANHRGGLIYAAAPGKVISCSYSPVYGNNIKIRHSSGYVTFYAHLDRLLVNGGQWVQAGVVIGRMGNTGRSTGTHLHFEVRQYGRVINPLRVTVMR